MEKEYFEWDGWDEVNTSAIQFYNCEMKEDLGPLKKGDEYDAILIDFEKGLVEVYSITTLLHSFKVRMVIDDR